MHKARKTYATKLIVGGVDKKLILRQMGHANIGTTDSFYYFDRGTIKQNENSLKKLFVLSDNIWQMKAY